MSNNGFGQPRHLHASSGVTILIVALALSGCMVGPNYHPPSAPLAPSFAEPAPAVTAPTIAGAIAFRDWWKIYRDSRLDDLENQADAANRDIKIAVAHVDEAAAATKTAHSYLLPTVSGQPSASRNREAQDRPNNGNTQ